MITFVGENRVGCFLLCFSLVCGLYTVCHDSLGVIGRLFSEIMVLP